MSPALQAHAESFRSQSTWADRLGSPFTAQLLRGLAEEIGGGGALDRLLSAFPRPEPVQAVPLRVTGALHALVLTGRAPALEATYPEQDPDWRVDRVVPQALSALSTHEGWAAKFLKSAPQTNETRRSIALMAGFGALDEPGPLHTLELGASAGLNLNWDRFTYRCDAWQRTGVAGAPVLDTDWTGPAPPGAATVTVGTRRGCDLNPLDVRRPANRLRLLAYVWPDQPDRLDRVRRAIALAMAQETRVDRASAASWLSDALSPPLRTGTTVVYHSIAWQYFDATTATAAEAAIEAAGARADTGHRLAWIRFEHDATFGAEGQGYRVDMITWPGKTWQHLADADPHARWVNAAPGTATRTDEQTAGGARRRGADPER